MLWVRVLRIGLARIERQRRRFVVDRRGTVAIISAIAIPALLGITGLVAELGHGLLSKAENQRVADLASYAGALAYNSTSSTTSMTAAAKSVAALNGIAASAVTASLVTSPRSATSQAVLVRIATSNLVLLAPVMKSSSMLAIGANSYAQLGAQTGACILALSASGTGVTLSGGTAVTAPGCAVASNNTVTVPCGTTISAKIVDYNSSAAPSQPCSGITANAITKANTADPVASNTGVSTATARMSSVAALTSPIAPAAPSVPSGKPIDFSYSPSSTQSQATAIGCTATFSSPLWTLTCPSGGTYNFSSLTIGGGINLNFNTSGTASTTYNFAQALTTSATTAFGPGSYNFALGITTNGTTTFGAGTYNVGQGITTNGTTTFGAGTFNVTQGITTGGGATTNFGAGTFNVGASTAGCNGGGTYSLCNGGGSTLVFGGPSTFTLTAGVYNGGGSRITLGSGTTNSFRLGASSDGNVLYLGGSAFTTFADATGASNLFQLNGNIVNNGGSCTTFGAAAQHDINGSMSIAGGTMLGTGVYTINGYFALGANGGGDVTCNGTSIGLNGTNVTLVISGVTTPSSGSCSGFAYCSAAGFGNVTLTAPTSATAATQGLAVIGPPSRTAGATFTDGSSNTSVSGIFYFPSGPITLGGGASIGNGVGQCLELIGSQVTLTGGTTAASTCVSGASSSSTSVSLVQ